MTEFALSDDWDVEILICFDVDFVMIDSTKILFLLNSSCLLPRDIFTKWRFRLVTELFAHSLIKILFQSLRHTSTPTSGACNRYCNYVWFSCSILLSCFVGGFFWKTLFLFSFNSVVSSDITLSFFLFFLFEHHYLNYYLCTRDQSLFLDLDLLEIMFFVLTFFCCDHVLKHVVSPMIGVITLLKKNTCLIEFLNSDS